MPDPHTGTVMHETIALSHEGGRVVVGYDAAEAWLRIERPNTDPIIVNGLASDGWEAIAEAARNAAFRTRPGGPT